MDIQYDTENKKKENQRPRWLVWVRACAFFVVFALALLWVQDLIVPNRDLPDNDRRLNKSISGLMLREEPNSMDILWVGTSHVHYGISPMEIYRKTGLRSYLISLNSQRSVTAYYLLKEAFKKQSPKLVIMDVSSFTYAKNRLGDKNNWQESIDALPLTSMQTRVEMGMELAKLNGEAFDDEYIGRSILPILQYHTHYLLGKWDWYDMHMEQPYNRKGFVASSRLSGVDEENEEEIEELIGENDMGDDLVEEENQDEEEIEDENDWTERAVAANVKYFKQIRSLCRQHGSKLVLIKVPVHTLASYRGHWSAEKHELFQEMAEKYKVKFLDLNYEDVGIDWQTDSLDQGMHLNLNGSKKLCNFLSKWLKSEFSLKKNKDEGLKAKWDAQLELYDWEMDYYKRCLTFDINKYCEAIKDKNVTLMTCVSGDVASFWTDELQQILSELTGCTADLRDPQNASFAMVSSGGTVIRQNNGKNDVRLSGLLEDNIAYEINSNTEKDNSLGNVVVDHNKLLNGETGLQIIVYDNDLHCVVDAFTIASDPKAAEKKSKDDTEADTDADAEAGARMFRNKRGYYQKFRLKSAEYIYKAMETI